MSKKKFSLGSDDKPNKTGFDTINKVKLMNSLATVADDEELADMIRNRPSGELVYNIFMNAIDSQLKELMEGEQEQAPEQMVDALRASAMHATTAREVQRFLSNLTNTQLLGSIAILNKNLGGATVEIDQNAIHDSALSVHIPQPVVPAPQAPVAKTTKKNAPVQQAVPQVIENVVPVAQNPMIRGF